MRPRRAPADGAVLEGGGGVVVEQFIALGDVVLAAGDLPGALEAGVDALEVLARGGFAAVDVGGDEGDAAVVVGLVVRAAVWEQAVRRAGPDLAVVYDEGSRDERRGCAERARKGR